MAEDKNKENASSMKELSEKITSSDNKDSGSPTASSQNACSIKELFQKFSPSGNKDSENQTVSFGSIQDWMKGMEKDKKIAEEETSSMLSNIAKSSKDSLNMEEFQQFIEQCASKMKMKTDELVSAMKDATPSGGSEKKGFIQDTVDSVKNFAGFKKEEKK